MGQDADVFVLNLLTAIGFNVETVTYKNLKFQVWDLGGQTSIRRVNFFFNVDVVMWSFCDWSVGCYVIVCLLKWLKWGLDVILSNLRSIILWRGLSCLLYVSHSVLWCREVGVPRTCLETEWLQVILHSSSLEGDIPVIGKDHKHSISFSPILRSRIL